MTVRTRSWPIRLFVAISLLLNVSIPPLIEWIDFGSLEKEILALLFFAGVVAGECCFVVLVAGLTKRTWLGAYLFGLGLAVVGHVAVLSGFWIVGEFDWELIAGLALLPPFLLVAASPLFGLRHCFGWRLAIDGETLPSRQPLRLADIFSLIAIVATVLVLVRVPQVVAEIDASEYWPPIVITCLILFGSGLVILPLHARVALGNRSVVTKLVGLVLLAILIVVGGVGISQFSFYASWSSRLEFLLYLFTFLGPAIGMFYLSLLLLSASCMRLVRGHDLKKEQQTDDAKQQVAHLRRLTWWRIGVAIAVTMATSIYLANLQQWRAARDKENAILTQHANATGSELGIDGRIPSSLRLGPRATDADFAAFAGCYDLIYLDMVGSRITDSGFANLRHFPRLQTLQVANASISDNGLVQLKHLPHLEALAIVNCPVKGSHLADLPQKRRLTRLNLTNTQFGDGECEFLIQFPHLQDLSLNSTRVTDRSVEALGKLSELTRLELIGTEIERFPYLPALVHLDLSGTRANDVTVSSIVRHSHLQFLSLRDTKVTNASIPSLASLKKLQQLDLSDNSIDDEGIRELGRETSLGSIDLSCTPVTGSGFIDWKSRSQFNSIILDRTLVDDQGVAVLMSITSVYHLGLAHTKVTDACLPYLAQMSITELDVRGTQITFSGFVNNQPPKLNTLHVTSGQFTLQQVSQLRQQQLGLTVTMSKP